MGEDQLKKLVHNILEANPSMLLDIIEAGPSPKPPPSSSPPKWCKCGNCRQMSKYIEKKCCDCLPQNCVSWRPEFELLVTNRMVVTLSTVHAADVLAYRFPNDNRTLRHGAYRQYVYWRHGILGTGNLKVIPSCCVWKIRDTYPDPNGQYTGFELRRGRLVWKGHFSTQIRTLRDIATSCITKSDYILKRLRGAPFTNTG